MISLGKNSKKSSGRIFNVWSLECCFTCRKKRSRSNIYRDRIKSNGYLGNNYYGSCSGIPTSSVPHCQSQSFENQGLSRKNLPSFSHLTVNTKKSTKTKVPLHIKVLINCINSFNTGVQAGPNFNPQKKIKHVQTAKKKTWHPNGPLLQGICRGTRVPEVVSPLQHRPEIWRWKTIEQLTKPWLGNGNICWKKCL